MLAPARLHALWVSTAGRAAQPRSMADSGAVLMLADSGVVRTLPAGRACPGPTLQNRVERIHERKVVCTFGRLVVRQRANNANQAFQPCCDH